MVFYKLARWEGSSIAWRNTATRYCEEHRERSKGDMLSSKFTIFLLDRWGSDHVTFFEKLTSKLDAIGTFPQTKELTCAVMTEFSENYPAAPNLETCLRALVEQDLGI